MPRLYTEVACALGLGRLYAPGGSDDALEAEEFEDNVLTSDPERYARNMMVLVGSPTIRWLRAALRSIARLTAPDYPLQVKVPLLLFAAGMDRVVSTTTIEEFALHLKVGAHVLIPQARHEILQETDEVRKDFWAAFDAYLGVDAPAT
jgi:lysophospholipase